MNTQPRTTVGSASCRQLFQNIFITTEFAGGLSQGGREKWQSSTTMPLESMKPLAQPAIDVVKDGKVRLVPERYKRIYLDWMENIRDWCISRQLWWGHRIPVWWSEDGRPMAACGVRSPLRAPDRRSVASARPARRRGRRAPAGRSANRT